MQDFDAPRATDCRRFAKLSAFTEICFRHLCATWRHLQLHCCASDKDEVCLNLTVYPPDV